INFVKDPRANLGSWGFGIAPPKPLIWQQYNAAVRTLLLLLQQGAIDDREAALSSVSEAKGLFNRIRRKDQWDWFIVWQRFGLPPISQLGKIVVGLDSIRDGIKEEDDKLVQAGRSRMVGENATTLLRRFLGDEPIMRTVGGGTVFVLSAKHNPQAVLV